MQISRIGPPAPPRCIKLPARLIRHPPHPIGTGAALIRQASPATEACVSSVWDGRARRGAPSPTQLSSWMSQSASAG
jgi:hypothetical protein